MNITELKELAEKATPGPWVAGDDEDSDYFLVGPCGDDGIVYQSVVKLHSETNADYIAAANPAAILELIAQLEDAQGEIRALRATEAGLRDRLASTPAQPAQQEPAKAIAYLDIGIGGYVDLGSELSPEDLAALPRGRHMLVIAGTYGIDGYKPVAHQEPPQPVERDARIAELIQQLEEARLKSSVDASEFNRAIDFAIDQGSEAMHFLTAWREGDTADWPEFAAAIKEQT